MPSRASQSPRKRVTCVAIVAVAVVSLASTVWARAQAVEVSPAPNTLAPQAVAESPGRNPFADRFTDVVLKTHEGKNVRFYDDLLKGKIVLINFMYANCKGR